VSIKERIYEYIKSPVEFESILFLPLCSILWYQIEKQMLCKPLMTGFIIKIVVKVKSNEDIEKLKKITSKVELTTNAKI
jgi:hypothetical protein